MDEPGIFALVQEWLARPFKADGTVLDWFLFLGVVMIAAFLWSRIIGEIHATISEI